MIEDDCIWPLQINGGNSFKIQAGFFKVSVYHTSGRFKPSAKLTIRQILAVEGDSDKKIQGVNNHGGADCGATVAFVIEVKRCHSFPLYCLKLAKDIFNQRLTVLCYVNESIGNPVLTPEAFRAVVSCRRISSFARLSNESISSMSRRVNKILFPMCTKTLIFSFLQRVI